MAAQTRNQTKGHIVKVDEPNRKALVLIEGPETSEYLWVNCNLIAPMIPVEEGQSFVLWERTNACGQIVIRYLPDSETKLMADDQFDKEAELLREAELPLKDYIAPSY